VPADIPQTTDLSQLTPESAARHRRNIARWLVTLDGHLEKKDWKTLRAASHAMRKMLSIYAGLITDRVAASSNPRDALIAGLLFERYIEQSTLDARLRDALGRRVVPLLASALRGDALPLESKHIALRLISRFPGESSRVALIGVIKDSALTREMRRLALFGMAEIGGPRDIGALRPLLTSRDPELVRSTALALGKIALRTGRPEVMRDLRPRLRALLGTALQQGDSALFDNVVQTAATLRELPAPAYLATHLLDDRTQDDRVISTGLQRLLDWRAVDQLPALIARRGRLGSPALNRQLESVIARLQQLK